MYSINIYSDFQLKGPNLNKRFHTLNPRNAYNKMYWQRQKQREKLSHKRVSIKGDCSFKTQSRGWVSQPFTWISALLCKHWLNFHTRRYRIIYTVLFIDAEFNNVKVLIEISLERKRGEWRKSNFRSFFVSDLIKFWIFFNKLFRSFGLSSKVCIANLFLIYVQ